MKLLLLKILLHRRARDEGFTLPVVIALGLIMVLLGLVNIISASEENLTAIATNSSTDSLAIAEIGIARYREFLDTNRVLAVYNRNRWSGANSNNVFGIDSVCSENVAAFANTANWQNVTLSEADAGADLNRDGDTTDTVNMGQYRIVDYIYDIDNNRATEDVRTINVNGTDTLFSNFSQTDDNVNTTDDVTFNDTTYNPRGILTVQGRTDPNGAVSQIEVEIPIRLNQQDMDNLAPALWIGSGDVSKLGNLTITDDNADGFGDTNIVATRPFDATTATAGCGNIDPNNTDNNVIISDPRNIPPIRSVVNTIDAARTETSGDQTNLIVTIPSVLGRPAPNDKPYVQPSDGSNFVDYLNRNTTTGDWDCKNISDCRYYYRNLLGLSVSTSTMTDGIAKATLYVDGNLTISEDIGSSISSSYLEIYVTGNVTINTGGGTVDVDAFIHAPNGTLTVSGGGNVNFNGSVWVNDFDNSAGTAVTIDPDNTSTSSFASDRSYKFYTTTNSRVPRPLTGSPTNWKTEEVTP